MPYTSPFRKSLRKLGKAPKLSARARKIRISYNPEYVPPVLPVAGLNQFETRIATALSELKVDFQVQQSYYGGSIAGGARADFYLPAYRMVLLADGPFHATSFGGSRDILTDLGYEQLGLLVRRIYERDLPRLKPRLLELIGTPVA